MRRLNRVWLCSALLFTMPAAAQQSADPEIKQLRDEITRLSQRLEQLEAARQQSTQQPALAQAMTAERPSSTQPLAVSRQQVARADLQPSDVPPSTNDRALQPLGTQLQLTASTDSSTASVRVTRSVSGGDEDTGTYSTLSLIASAPLNKSGGSTDIGTLDGFVSSSRLRLQWSRFQRTFVDPDSAEYRTLVETVRTRCRAVRGDKCDRDLVDNNFVATYAPDLETRFLELFRTREDGTVDRGAIAFGAEASVGYSQFKYLLPLPARRTESDRIPIGGKAFFSWLPNVRKNSLTVGAEYQRAFEERSSGTLCPLSLPATELSCLTGPLGRPGKKERLIGSLEYRQMFYGNRNGLVPAWGFSTQLSYDALNDDFAVDVPLYLVGDSKGRVSGGVRFGYTTAGDDVAVGVFVGTSFSPRRQ